MQQRRIADRQVSAIGLGAMPMSTGGHMPDERQSIRT
nr:aldo/keto reductase [Sporichthyaceae bacterium]